jgi:hypothetical protein
MDHEHAGPARTFDQQQARNGAKDAVRTLASQGRIHDAYRDRLLTLIDFPDSLDQGHRGICAMTSVVHTLLLHDIDKFIELVEGVFDDWDAMNIGTVEVHPEHLQDKLLKQTSRKIQSLPGDDRPHAIEVEVDFLLARALGKVLKLASPATFNRLLSLNQQSFTRLFLVKAGTIDLPVKLNSTPEILKLGLGAAVLLSDLPTIQSALLITCGFGMDLATMALTETVRNAQWELTWRERSDTHTLLFTKRSDSTLGVAVKVANGIRAEGDLAFDSEALQTLMELVYGSKGSVLPGGNPKVIPLINQALTYPKSYAYGLVNGVNNWWAAHGAAAAGKPPADQAFTFDGPPATRRLAPGLVSPPGEHFVVITGAITAAEAFYSVPVWTWGQRFTVRVARAHIGAYFPSIVCGFLG